jgi:hypothetical protein
MKRIETLSFKTYDDGVFHMLPGKIVSCEYDEDNFEITISWLADVDQHMVYRSFYIYYEDDVVSENAEFIAKLQGFYLFEIHKE